VPVFISESEIPRASQVPLRHSLSTADPLSTEHIADRVLLLAQRCRRAGVPVGLTEIVDAFRATTHTDLSDRDHWRVALRSCVIKHAEHLAVFDDLFDRLFPIVKGPSENLKIEGLQTGELAERQDLNAASEYDSGHSTQARFGADQLGEAARIAIAAGDVGNLRLIAEQAVEAFSGLSRGGSSEKQYLLRVTRAIDLANLLQRALRDARVSSQTSDVLTNSDDCGGSSASGGRLDVGLARSEAVALVEAFRRMLAREVTRRLAELLPIETITTVKYPDDVAFLESTVSQRAELRSTIQPLARKLAARMAQRRRLRSTGRLDVRRTARRSLTYGGVPVQPVFRAKRASKPDLVVLCDVSGSVAEFAHFMLTLLHALHTELGRLRTFVFVDGVAEVTDLFGSAQHDLDPMHLLSQPGVIQGDGHSDFGAVLASFTKSYVSTTIRKSTTVLIAGDARNNYRDANTSALERIAERARAVYWLNPEPASDWGQTDSAIDSYRGSCNSVFEVRTTRQLAAAVLEIDAAIR
jgi:uncharacterized protein